MKVNIKSSVALLCLSAALYSPITFASPQHCSPIPEAETYAMMLVGLGLVGFMVYRRRNE